MFCTQIHALTADRDYELRINAKVQNLTNYKQYYSNFRVTNETSGYRLYFNASRNNGPQDCFLPLLNAQFSTYDHDMDGDAAVNCAALRKGGMWYRGSSGCSACNPHGILYRPEDGRRVGVEDEVFWDNMLGDIAVFKISMYLLPLDPW